VAIHQSLGKEEQGRLTRLARLSARLSSCAALLGNRSKDNCETDLGQSLDHLDQMDQVDRLDQMDQVDHLNQMDHLDQMDQVDRLNQMDHLDQVDRNRLSPTLKNTSNQC